MPFSPYFHGHKNRTNTCYTADHIKMTCQSYANKLEVQKIGDLTTCILLLNMYLQDMYDLDTDHRMVLRKTLEYG